ncbi:beta-ketoacyl-ACP synthase II [Zongyangia hominis]|uniref:3-oxoacyl-[acyl-carrier-protein] synthase 2 n=1 Tax=Zongyangia hominis TaxID=2763677 RepID=A0A926I6N5_9FIRM|nr:beta-ketoacyl-ACP synthase II [Zongyangia hominis]MBC8570239.1 beta-ketoacyl-ACP synthase II [Zongyangia hominis]
MNRVVVTGIGAVTPVGTGVAEMWKNIQAGMCGIGEITHFDTSDFDIKLAAEVRDFDPTAYISKKEARRMDRYCQFACAAASLALTDADSKFEDDDPFRVGVILGSGIGGIGTFEEEHLKSIEKGYNRVSPFFIPMMISNMGCGMIAMQHGFKGANFTAVTACSSANHAIGEAYRNIKYGYLDVAVTGGAEATITKFAAAGFHNMGALTKSQDPTRASIPFDKERSGFVMGEGSVMLVLEELEHAKKRGAKIYGEVVGYGATADAYHITSPDPEGAGAAKAMELAIEEAGIRPDQVGYINAHGTSTPINDKYETRAVKKVFGEQAKEIPMSSTKSMTGHMLGAAGAMETAVSVLALRDGVLPPTIGFQVPDEECDLDYVTEGARKADITYAITNSLGFGGQNATLCLKKYQGE